MDVIDSVLFKRGFQNCGALLQINAICREHGYYTESLTQDRNQYPQAVNRKAGGGGGGGGGKYISKGEKEGEGSLSQKVSPVSRPRNVTAKWMPARMRLQSSSGVVSVPLEIGAHSASDAAACHPGRQIDITDGSPGRALRTPRCVCKTRRKRVSVTKI